MFNDQQIATDKVVMSYGDSDNTDLQHLMTIHRDSIEELARVWLAHNVQAFAIWSDKHLVCWPETAREMFARSSDSAAVISACVTQGEQEIGKIGVRSTGILEPVLKQRLQADANFISQLATIQTKFERTARELIAQAQLKMEIDLAAGIQLQLLPQSFLPVPGLDIYAYSTPAKQVGGDFYDMTVSKDRPFIFAVGDVSGKGLGAALFMAMTRIVLHAAARFVSSADPKVILRRVNEDLYDDFTEVGMFATVFVGSYDGKAQRLTYANAGHSPVIYCRAGGPATLLQADSTAVGVLSESQCGSYSLAFHPNDILLAGTDGLNEGLSPDGEMFGYERLLKIVEELAHLPSRQLGAQILEAIRQFTGGASLLDDQTLFIVKGSQQES